MATREQVPLLLDGSPCAISVDNRHYRRETEMLKMKYFDISAERDIAHKSHIVRFSEILAA